MHLAEPPHPNCWCWWQFRAPNDSIVLHSGPRGPSTANKADKLTAGARQQYRSWCFTSEDKFLPSQLAAMLLLFALEMWEPEAPALWATARRSHQQENPAPQALLSPLSPTAALPLQNQTGFPLAQTDAGGRGHGGNCTSLCLAWSVAVPRKTQLIPPRYC